MGNQISPTYSYYSRGDSINKMLKNLNDNEIKIYYDDNKFLYFIVEYPNLRRYIRTRQQKDITGNLYFECYVENDKIRMVSFLGNRLSKK